MGRLFDSNKKAFWRGDFWLPRKVPLSGTGTRPVRVWLRAVRSHYARDWIDTSIVLGTISGGVAGVWFATKLSALEPIVNYVELGDWTRLIIEPSIVWAIMGAGMLLLRTLFWLRYKPEPPAAFTHAPMLTVVIPAYNEGAMVERAIGSVATAEYPPGRLEIFVVDDGSKDDTWTYIEQAASHYPQLVTAIRFSENRGKRAALAEGFAKACGDLVVTIDSDSEITPGSLLALAGPFRDPKVGAVAGKVTVLNVHEGLIPQMLKIRYILSFDFLRAYQSVFRTVYTCPGALAAYRTSVVRKILPAWMNQTFLGVKCTFGEDRALTNWILSEGYDALYQNKAVVRTIVPVTYRKLSGMYLRWNRSYVREDIRLTRIVWRRPLHIIPLVVFDKLITNLRFPVGYALIGLLIFLVPSHPLMLVRFGLVVGLAASFYSLFYLRNERSWDAFYGVIYAYYSLLVLSWIFPWAVVTVRARAWLTR